MNKIGMRHEPTLTPEAFAGQAKCRLPFDVICKLLISKCFLLAD